MEDTYYAGKRDPSKGETYSYAYGNGWDISSETDPSVPLGAGGIISTPTDLTAFAEGLFAKGNHLYGQVPGQEPILFDARRAGKFECSRGGIEIEFCTGYDEFVLRQAGQEYSLIRKE